MKTQNLIKVFAAISIAMIFIPQSMVAQCQTNTFNGNALPGFQNNIFGTSTNPIGVNKLDIRFFTNGSERMRLIGEPGFNTGFLGIGLTVPAYRLDVQDNINVNTIGFGNGYRIDAYALVVDGQIADTKRMVKTN